MANLKDQIKKLQKDRDKIKTWHVPAATSSGVQSAAVHACVVSCFPRVHLARAGKLERITLAEHSSKFECRQSATGAAVCRMGDKDVRDKKDLQEARASIERRMEKFKECEKDMKVKNFSKLGLDRGAKQDPRVAALEERSEWLRKTLEALNNMVRLLGLR